MDTLDRQCKLERELMGALEDDWFIDDDFIDVVNVIEYRIYEVECREKTEEDFRKKHAKK